MAAPIELDVKRNSYWNPDTVIDIKNPRWIPVLGSVQTPEEAMGEKEALPTSNSTNLKKSTQSPSPANPQPPKHKTHTYSKSSSAPETIVRPEASSPLPPLPPSLAGVAVDKSTSVAASIPLPPTTDSSTSNNSPRAITRTVSNEDLTPQAFGPNTSEDVTTPRPNATSSALKKQHYITPPTSRYNRKPASAKSGQPPLQSPTESISQSAVADERYILPHPVPQHQSDSLAPGAPGEPRTPSFSAAQRELSPPPQSGAGSPLLSVSASPPFQDSPTSETYNIPPPTTLPPDPPVSAISLPTVDENEAESTPILPAFSQATPCHEHHPQCQMHPNQRHLQSVPNQQESDQSAQAAIRKQSRSEPRPSFSQKQYSAEAQQADQSRSVGYAGLVSFMTENDAIIFRRFDDVHMRLLLFLQNEIAQLEIKLKRLDEINKEMDGMHDGSLRGDSADERMKVMLRLRGTVRDYGT